MVPNNGIMPVLVDQFFLMLSQSCLNPVSVLSYVRREGILQ